MNGVILYVIAWVLGFTIGYHVMLRKVCDAVLKIMKDDTIDARARIAISARMEDVIPWFMK